MEFGFELPPVFQRIFDVKDLIPMESRERLKKIDRMMQLSGMASFKAYRSLGLPKLARHKIPSLFQGIYLRALS